MDPLGVPVDIVEINSLKRWSKITPRDLPDASNFGNQEKIHQISPFPYSEYINKKVVLWAGDLSCLRAQAIVNSTNETLNDKNPLSERILRRAGLQLKYELHTNIKGCRTGEAKLTKGYNLPAQYIMHTVGPKYNVKYQTAAESALFSCYFKILQLVREHSLTSLGLCVINSIRRGYPPHEGAHIALRTVRRFIEKFGEDIEVVVFAVDDVDVGIYELLMPLYYPRSKIEEEYAMYYLPPDVGGINGEPFLPERQIRIVDKPFHDEEDLEQSVDLAKQLESSVNVGKTSFAKMHGDVDKKRTSSQKISVNPDTLITEVQRKNKYERLIRRSRIEDLRSIENLRCLYHCGEDRFGRPVIVFIGHRLRLSEVNIDKAILYLIHTMDQVVRRDYIVVYFHSLTTKENHLPLSFLKDVYSLLDFTYKKNLRSFYIVHPTFWSRVMTWWFTTFTASTIKDKIQSLGGIEYLYYLIPPEQLDIPEDILEYDNKINGVRYCTRPATDAAAAL
ncbi:protein GDAP2 homolog [Limulus polyphemus]|uniref:Protein GDAP2 homolog n=1 Tax=Limulus polyphemus TaxID=6850 RepID=A0ABM1BE58_LIMPO|nr:protein GDAP2 homolog [Limulus polyphemus]XP_013780165.1 protein GDAP2 homolog [Limulus polyphemus]XP_013780167.1 protein GDAP2 homolog [Limulus polyphemus]